MLFNNKTLRANSVISKDINKKIHNHFKNNDLILYSYIKKIGKLDPIIKDKPNNYFFRLCREIVCQQLSGKAGDAIFSRFLQLFPKGRVEPSNVLTISHEQLRRSGMSNAKVRYVKNLAEKIVNENFQLHTLDVLSDTEVVEKLTKVKGIGPWTAEMFLMFVLGRENVFSFGDLGLKKAIVKMYGFKKELTRKQVEKIISKWSPYKTYASRVLWESLKLKD